MVASSYEAQTALYLLIHQAMKQNRWMILLNDGWKKNNIRPSLAIILDIPVEQADSLIDCFRPPHGLYSSQAITWIIHRFRVHML